MVVISLMTTLAGDVSGALDVPGIKKVHYIGLVHESRRSSGLICLDPKNFIGYSP